MTKPDTIRPAELDEVLDIAEPEEEVSAPVETPATVETPDPQDLSIAQLQLLLDQKLRAVADKEVTVAEKAPGKAPSGMLWVYNRGPKPFVWQYDGIPYEIAGHEMMLFPERIARHGRKRSLLSLDPVANTAVFALALECTPDGVADPKFGIPLRVVNRMELIDRSTTDNPLGAGSPVPTHLTAIKVGGSVESMMRRPDNYVELE